MIKTMKWKLKMQLETRPLSFFFFFSQICFPPRLSRPGLFPEEEEEKEGEGPGATLCSARPTPRSAARL